MKRWKLGALLAAVLMLLLAALPAWAEVGADSRAARERIAETMLEAYLSGAQSAEEGFETIAEAELGAYLSSAGGAEEGTLIDAGYLKMLVTPTVCWMSDRPVVVVYAPGATEIKVNDNDAYTSDGEFLWCVLYDIENGGSVSASALIDGQWVGPCEPVIVQKNNYGKMAAPVVTVPTDATACRPFTISWTEAQSAEGYDWEICKLGSNEPLVYGWGRKLYATINGLPAGQYQISVYPYASGWDIEKAKNVQFTVADAALDTRVQLSASATKIEASSERNATYPVELTVTAAGADAYRLYSANQEWEQDSNVFALNVDGNATYFAYARVNGQWYGPSAPVSVELIYAEPDISQAPVVAAPEGCVAYQPFSISWTPMAGASEYRWRVIGLSIGSIGGSVTGTTATVQGLPAGRYQLQVEAIGSNWIVESDVQFTIADTQTDTRVQLTTDATGVPIGERITLTGSAPNATSYRLYSVCKGLIDEQVCADSSCEFFDRLSETDTYYLYAKIDGEWCGPSERLTVRATQPPILDTPIVTMPASIEMNTPIAVSWTPVEHAQGYYWNIYNTETNRYVSGGSSYDGKTSTTIEQLPAGKYAFRIVASGSGWYQSSASFARFSITLPEANARVQLTTEATDVMLRDYVQLTVTAEGADAYWLYSQETGMRLYQEQDNSFGIQPEKTDTYYAYARVNGEWIGPSELVTIKVKTLGQLKAPVITVPTGSTAYRPVTISWSASDNADYYEWTVIRRYANGTGWTWIAGGQSGETSARIANLSPGQYEIQVTACASRGWLESNYNSAEFSVGDMQPDTRVQVAASATEVLYGQRVEITVTAEGADLYRLYCPQDRYFEREQSSNVFEVHPYETSSYYAYAHVGDEWFGPSELVTVRAKEPGTLDAPVIAVPEGCTAFRPFTLSWGAVENAQEYWWCVYDLNTDEWLKSGWTQETSVTVNGMPEGQYGIQVQANGDGWYANTGRAQFTIAEVQPDPRVQFSVSPTDALCGQPVEMTVTADGADAYRIYTVKNGLWNESTYNTFRYNLSNPYTFYAYAHIGDEWCGPSELVTVQVTTYGNLDKPVVTAPEGCKAYTPFTLSWSAVENAQEYSWNIYRQDTDEYVTGGRHADFAATIDGLPEGQYTVRVYAYGDGWVEGCSDEISFTVAAVQTDTRVQLTASKTVVVEGQTVTMTVTAEDADAYRLYTTQGGLYSESTGNAFDPTVYETKTYYAYARIGGVWCGPSEMVTVQATQRGTLDTPVITVPEGCTAYTPITISWDAVEHAQRYWWCVYNPNDTSEQFRSDWTQDTTVTIDGLSEGQYGIWVQADGDEWYVSTGEALLTIAAAQIDDRVQLSASATDSLYRQNVDFTITAEGADAYRLYSVQDGRCDESSSNKLYDTIYETDTYYAYARIDGEWYGPSAPVTVNVIVKGKLDPPVLTAPEECAKNRPFAFSWSAVEHAQFYWWHIFDALANDYVAGGSVLAMEEKTVVVDGLPAGEYNIYVEALGDGWYSSELVKAHIIVTSTETAPYIQLTASETSVVEGQTVTMTVTAEGADAYRLYTTRGGLYSESTNNVFDLTVYETETYYAYARIGGEWYGPSELVTVEATEKGTLDTPAITVPEGCTAYTPITISWNAVEHAQKYWWCIYNPNDTSEQFRSGWTQDTTVTFDGLSEGQYGIWVQASGDEWSGTVEARLTVAAPQIDDRVQISAAVTDSLYRQNAYFTITAEGADAYRLYSARYGLCNESSSNELYTTTYVTDAYYAYARIDGEWYGPSAPVTVNVIVKGKLDPPVLTAPEECAKNRPFAFSWSAVENAQFYWWHIFDALANDYVTGGSVLATEEKTVAVDGLPVGEYDICVEALSDGWYNSELVEAHIIVASAETDPHVQLTVSETSVLEGQTVAMTVTPEGADTYRLCTMEGGLYSESSSNVFDLTVYETDTYYAYARIGGEWVGPSEMVTVQAREKKLDMPVVTAPEGCTAYAPFTISWSAVENAQEYYWRIDRQNTDEYVQSGWALEPTVTVERLPEGQYTLQVYAWAGGWKDSDTSSVQFTVSNAQTDDRLQLVASTTDALYGQMITMTITAEGAQAYRLYTARNGLYSESSENVFYLTANETQTYYVYAYIGGEWCGPSASVTVQVTTYGSLDAFVVTTSEGVKEQVPFTISWSAVENAQRYDWEICTPWIGGTRTWVKGGSTYGDTSVTVDGLLEGQYTVQVYAYADGWVSNSSNELPFTVAPMQVDDRVRLTASAAEVFKDSSVELTVNAEGADTYRLYTVREGLWGESSDNGFAPTVNETETYYACARIDGVWYGPSEMVTVEAKEKRLDTPVVTAPEGCTAYTPFTVSWSAVENAQQYYWHINKQGTDEYVTGEWVSEPIATITGLLEGQYTLEVYAWASGWIESDTSSVQFTVAETQTDERVQLTANKTEVFSGRTVEMTVTAEGADAYRLYSVQNGLRGESSYNRFYQYPYSTDTYFAYARIGGVWCGPSAPVTVQAKEMSKLDAPVVTAPEGCVAYRPFTVSWSAVENAQKYYCSIYRQDTGEYMTGLGTSESNATVLGLPEGQYQIWVYAYADEWYSSDSTNALFTVAEAPTDARVQLSANKAEVIKYFEEVTFTVNAEGADAYLLFSTRHGTKESSSNVFSLTTYETDTYCASARINGEWYGPSEPVTVQAIEPETLDTPVVTVPEGCKENHPFTISWSDVPNAQKYNWSIYTLNTGRWVKSGETESASVKVVGLLEGQYEFCVWANADGWYASNTGRAEFTVTVAPPDARVQLTAGTTNALLGQTVNMTVSAKGASAYRLYRIQEGLLEESTSNRFELTADETDTYYAYAQIDGVWCGPSESVTVSVRTLGKLNPPTVTTPKMCEANRPFTVTWNAVEKAQWYTWNLYTPELYEWIAGGTINDTTMTMEGQPEGTYVLHVVANAIGWEDSKPYSTTFDVSPVMSDANVQLTASQTEVLEHFSTELTVTAEGAEAYRLYTEDGVLCAEQTENVFTLYPTEAHSYYAYAQIGGLWYGPSAYVTVHVVTMSTLDTPVVTVPESTKANHPFTVSWNAVANAQKYSWSIYTQETGKWIDGGETSNTSVSIAGLPEGQYEVCVWAYAEDWYASQTGKAQFTVTVAQPDVRVRLSASASEVPVGDTVNMTVSAQGASAYRLYRIQSGLLEESTSNVFALSVNGASTYYAYALIDGVWCGPSESVTVYTTAVGKLDTPDVIKPEGCVANSPFTIWWYAVKNAQSYTWSLYTPELYEWITGGTVTDTKVTLDGMPEGKYVLYVVANAVGWSESKPYSAMITIDPEPVRVQLSVSETQVSHGQSVNLTVTAEGADAYRLYPASDASGAPLMESDNNVFSISVTKPGCYVATACVNGVWQAPSDPVTVVLTANMALPSAVKQIEAEAFMGSAFTVVQCPQGMTSIGAKAFANCPNLVQVTVPSSVTAIADDAFAGSDVTLCGAEGSYAQQWAQAHGVPWVTKP